MTNVVDFPSAQEPSDLIKTDTFQKVWHVLDDCCQNRNLGVITGCVGGGKTSVLRAFANEMPQAVALLTLNPAFKTTTAAMNALLDVVKTVDTRYPNISSHKASLRAHRAFMENRTRLRRMVGRTPGPLVIVDEAQYAQPEALDTIRALHDQGVCGLVIAGNDRLFNTRRGRMEAADFSALLSRARHVINIPRSTARDVDAVLNAYRISSQQSRDLLHARAEHGGLREVVAIIQKACALSGTALVAHKHIKAAVATTGLSAFNSTSSQR